MPGSSQPPPPPTPRRVNAAVIGAGPAGLVAARELRREGHTVTVFEKGSQVGGTWLYTPESESDDPLGLDPTRPVIVHSSMYESLRTNLPREVMGFMDYPFTAAPAGGDDVVDERRFPGHREVLRYLKEFAREFGINEEIVRFEREVVGVAAVGDGGRRWKVTSVYNNNDHQVEEEEEEVFDAVVVCNGHHTQPRIADFPGLKSWPGKQTHSHNYRTPDPFKDQVVVVIGNSASGADLAIDIAGVATEVHVASKSPLDDPNHHNHPSQIHPSFPNIWIHSMVEKACEDGSVVFQDGTTVFPNIILHCTGYTYRFPFFESESGIVTVDDNCVRPLYKHVFPPALAPRLSFVGVPYKTLIFPMFELQSKWISGALSGRIPLPSPEEMTREANAFYAAVQDSGVPKRHTHNMFATASSLEGDYHDWLAAQCRCRGVESWRRGMFFAAIANFLARPETFRDEWEDDELVLEARHNFAQFHLKQ